MVHFLKWLKLKENNKLKSENKNSNNVAYFNICIKDKSEILSKFIIEEKEIINSEFAHFLENAIKPVSPKKNIELKLSCKNMSLQEQSICSNAIKNYYYNQVLDSQRRQKLNLILFWFMVVFSIFSLGLLFLVNFLQLHWIISEIIDIVVWVFVWESVDLIAFQRRILKYEKQRFLSLYNSKISFI